MSAYAVAFGVGPAGGWADGTAISRSRFAFMNECMNADA